MRLNQIARKIDVSTETIVQFFDKKGIVIRNSPNTKLTLEQIDILVAGLPEAKKLVSKGKEQSPISLQSTPTHAVETPKEPKSDTPFLKKNNLSRPAPNSAEPVVLQNTSAVLTAHKQPKKHENPQEKPIEISTIEKIDYPQPITSLKVYEKKPVSQESAEDSMKETHQEPLKEQGIRKPSFISYPSRNFPRKRPSRSRTTLRRKRKRKTIKSSTNAIPAIQVTELISTQDLASLLDVSPEEIMNVCQDMDLTVSLNQRLNASVIELIAETLEKDIELVSLSATGKPQKQKSAHMQPRNPVLVIMGHVDHGKTSLVDFLRKTKIVDKESGGITQHIGAYQVGIGGRLITFLDTPGHKAFTAMRTRGTQVADIALIVIDANDGVMPQTKEAISHAKMGSMPMVFALNKIDKPGADPDRVKQQLSKIDIIVEEWGGSYQCENISAKTGEGIDSLLEKILLEADLLDLKADPTISSSGTIIESSFIKGRGYISTIIGKEGTLNVGDIIVAETYYGKVKALYNAQDKPVKHAPPSFPVQVLGLNGAPQAGTTFKIVNSEQEARKIASQHKNILKDQQLRVQHGSALQRMQKELVQGATNYLNVVLKADTNGSIEAFSDMLATLSNEHGTIRIIYKGVGNISESDALLAASAQAIIIGFHIKVDSVVRNIITKNNTTVIISPIIYEIIERIQNILDPAKKANTEEVFLGRADVVKVFQVSKVGTIAGCIVQKGLIKKSAQIHIIRAEKTLYTGPIRQLKREKEIIKEAKKGTECGISTAGFHDIQEGDIIECFEEKPIV